MYTRSRLVTVGVQISCPTQQCRRKSTTSAIRAGLRAEQTTRGGASRDRPQRRYNDTRPPTNLERGSGRQRLNRRDDGRPSRDVKSSANRRAVFTGYLSSRDREQQEKLALEQPVRSRTTRPRVRPDYPTDESGQPLPRKQRRALFWEQKNASEDESTELPLDESNGVEDQDMLPQRRASSARSSEQHLPRRTRAPRSQQIDADDDDGIPMPIPYTTASSQFIYGSNAVMAALLASKRKLYKLFMHKRSEAGNIAQIRRQASQLGIEITRTADQALLDRLSEGRPHNGVVLEASAIPSKPVLALEAWNSKAGMFKIELAEQNTEEAAINGTDVKYRCKLPQTPLVLFLDGITDPGNVGNIIRTAHFFGVDAVAIAKQTCASINSPILAKASAGACEAIPIFTVPHASGFVYSSRQNGWKICAAVAPSDLEADVTRQARLNLTTDDMSLHSSLTDKPCVLMLGAEGEGLRENLKTKADAFITIAGANSNAGHDVGVDSLNVATAAALLINAFKSKMKVAKKSVSSIAAEESNTAPGMVADEATATVQDEVLPAVDGEKQAVSA